MKKIASLLLLIFAVQFSFAQVKKRTYKTLHETSYSKGDLILCPEIIYYDARLDERGKDSLKIIAAFLLKNPSFSIEVNVYTDHRGNDSYNKHISVNRANCIVDYLNRINNIPLQRMKSNGYGEEDPVYTQEQINKESNTDKKNIMYAANRRTEIKILSVK